MVSPCQNEAIPVEHQNTRNIVQTDMPAGAWMSVSFELCSMCLLCRFCCSIYCLRVNVYCTTATGWQLNFSKNTSYRIKSYHIWELH